MNAANKNRVQIRRSNERGVSMVEFALLAPLLLLILMGIIQYGLIFASYIALRNAAHSTARFATLTNPTPMLQDVQTFAQNQMLPPLKQSSLIMTTYDSAYPVGKKGEPLQPVAKKIDLTYDMPVLISFAVPGSKNGKLTIKATAVMR